jgi:hypothetical protein|nr:MAG TPA: hypothetical protein [Caudoviricetes sp.]DAY08924.1 MAG TPA: hypothetical protein [Caudoviricetes sp.]
MFKISFELYQFLMIIGFPTVFITCMRAIWVAVKKIDIENKAVQRGVQALLRSKLYSMYNRYSEQGFAPLYAKENFKNMYEQYHNLGENGVMDNVFARFMELPDGEKEKEDKSC